MRALEKIAQLTEQVAKLEREAQVLRSKAARASIAIGIDDLLYGRLMALRERVDAKTFFGAK